ncbi:MAG TPA: cytochrome c oxidase assembly protein [Ktedonobacterales bacterium]|nr:cytochrome c oxidase assembly protein [Ktedonobacterales bacterium]
MVISSAASMPGEWTFWSWLLLAVLVIGLPAWYFAGLKRFRSQDSEGASLSAGQVSAFFVALGLAAVAFLLPMDALGMNYVFTVHMAQHLLLSLAAPPLLIIGLPAGFWRALFSHPACRRALHWLTRPFVAAALFNGNIWLWHAPALLFLMMVQPTLHLLANLLYLITGLLFWWPLFSPLEGKDGPLPLGGKLAYLFFSDMPMMLLGAGLTFTSPLYTMPMGPQGQASMTVLASDQQLGGLLMWVVGGIFLYVVVGSGLFLQWMLRQERLEQMAEAASDQ